MPIIWPMDHYLWLQLLPFWPGSLNFSEPNFSYLGLLVTIYHKKISYMIKVFDIPNRHVISIGKEKTCLYVYAMAFQIKTLET